LRFAPLIKEKEATSNGGLLSKLMPRRHRSSQEKRKDDIVDNKQHVWILRDKQLVAIAIVTGVSDGKMTEVISGDIEPGMELVVDTMRERQ
ncbi:MAG: efflux RND transporter periplasmic adaptor subunit, partial [Proteobacteria bacterium]|nr:efflux RND transporter periplasmic adaptor subunit [Pseudomonadota bacterium]